MTLELIITSRRLGALGCALEDGRLLDVTIEDEEGGFQDRIFLGRVRALEPALDAAFVDLGGGEPGLLTGRDARFLSGAARGTPITQQLTEGQAVLVQGRREAGGGKGPRVTGALTLAGPSLVLRPRRAEVGLSVRLRSAPDAPAQRARAEALFQDGNVLLRSAAREASDAELLEEAKRLRALWCEIEARAAKARAPACVHQAGTPVERLLVRHSSPQLARLAVDDHGGFLEARRYLEQIAPALAARLEFASDAFVASGAQEQVEQALSPTVPLQGGGRLIIQTTAALIAIDVDGGGRGALEANLAAVPELARQARLRRLGGTIVVDFVDLSSRRDQARLHTALRHAFQSDPLPVNIAPMGPFGLIVISRGRRGLTLAEQLGRPCPVCAGHGRLWSLAWQSEAVMRALGGRPGHRLRARLAPDLHQYLEREGADLWRAFVERERPQVRLTSDTSLPPGEFAVESQETS